MTIVEFIKARLDEDETTARAASVGGAWRYDDGDSVGAWTLYDEQWAIASLTTYRHETYDYATQMPAFRHPRYVDADANGEHIARHDPARVLHEVEAKRAIVDLYERVERDSWGTEDNREPFIGEQYLRDVLLLLALPYSDHPDYDPTWSPA